VNIQVREAGNDDLEAVLSLLELLYKGDVGGDFGALVEEYVNSPDHLVLLAVRERPVGVLVGSYRLDIDFECRAGLVDAVVVSESSRQKGVGRALLLRFRDWARRKGCSVLQVVNPNEGFFARMGFSDREARFWQAAVSAFTDC
jgi:N-acetylglutamate synthase-like GNAT family acetyltransferase